MKILTVIEYEGDNPSFSLTAMDSNRTAWTGGNVISSFDISKYCDIFFVDSKEDLQKFKKSGLDLKDFYPMHDASVHQGGISTFGKNVVREICDWAKAKRIWLYRSTRLTGPDRKKFEDFYNGLEWRNYGE
jgi:hypothetical protein